MAKIREVMSTTLFSVEPGTSVGEAVSLMAQHKVGSTLVMVESKLVGIFTERDIVRAISHSHDAPTHDVSSWMTHDPKTISPEVEIQVALRTMLDNGFRHLPVVENGKVVGMVSIRDLAGA
jgi:CBS domain-containing protein